MTQRTTYTFDDISALLAKGQAERSRVLAEMFASAPRKVTDFAKAARAWLAKRGERARIYRELYGMDDRMLADIGLTPGEIDLVASGQLTRGSLRKPALQAANESVAPAGRLSPRAA
jgi:uncharacterized protein YjiS (DUF1127 family)